MRPALRLLAHACLLVALLAACGERSTPSGEPSPTPPTSPTAPTAPAAGLVLQGDPESAAGATWTYRATVDGVVYDLKGVLFKPRGAGPFPAVVVSHGYGGSAATYSRGIAVEMVRWGLVAIATDYTHAAVPSGAPGTSADPGASTANVQRAHRTYELLRSLGYVDMRRVAAHGHSMGAFVTAALLAAYPADFRAASHTAGGVRVATFDGAAPTEAQAATIRTPYQLHHGDRDAVVLLAADQRLASVLTASGTTHELQVYPGADHDDVARSAAMLERVRAWYGRWGMF
ncbi:alpha/beta hydrolase family protein [Roseisolibacter agri]|uniref:Dienelactone hydrolase domain-containing protein n=1 Tax=Roseisolibacter agri TaxID=2014610 RepID=A0AA37QG98_9BACT|nr:dienelactone hydrolase family protein [Roseisolibacter agri]GLC25860.1 hypothetical protein rosag_23730 [Roseisolibacter agri]